MRTTFACQECGHGELDAIHNYADVKDFHEFVYHLDDLMKPKTDLDKAIDLICLLRAQLSWCGGSPDFLPGGQARIGWEKGPAKSIEEATKFINEA